MTPEWATAIGSGPILLAFIAWVVTHRKTRADTAKVLTDIARDLAQDLADDLAAVRTDLEAHKTADKADKDKRRANAREHARWDRDVAEQLRAAGIEVEDPPPLDEEG
ncbi:hypothetical protein [Rhodococcus sp. NPDC127528]|uniref:hypothetical protein n=1 Tax=unclassified Rhodococcus (in: high G+C Gram-positive bacteria) TaxID=192944 RepID=UPI0036409104